MNYFVLTYIGKSFGESGESCNSNYDLTEACKTCGTGALLVGNLRIRGIKDTQNMFFQTLDDDYIISERLYKIMLDAEMKIGNLLKVINKKGEELPYYHFHTGFILPKTNELHGLKIENQCPSCKRNGYFNDAEIGNIELGISTKVKALELKYLTIDESFLRQSDIFYTYETIGLSNLVAEGNKVTRYARPLLVVSERIKALFFENNIKNAFFEKIAIN